MAAGNPAIVEHFKGNSPSDTAAELFHAIEFLRNPDDSGTVGMDGFGAYGFLDSENDDRRHRFTVRMPGDRYDHDMVGVNEAVFEIGGYALHIASNPDVSEGNMMWLINENYDDASDVDYGSTAINWDRYGNWVAEQNGEDASYAQGFEQDIRLLSLEESRELYFVALALVSVKDTHLADGSRV